MKRFLRRSATEGLRRFLDVRENLPTDLEESIQATYDVQSQRFWQEYDEQVARWWIRTTVTAIVGQISCLRFDPNPASFPGFTTLPPRGTLQVIDTVQRLDPTVGDLLVVAGPNAAVAPGTIQPVYRDTRWGGFAAVVPMPIHTGQSGGGGANVDAIQVPAAGISSKVFLDWVSRVPDGEALQIQGPGVNTTFTVVVKGRIVLP